MSTLKTELADPGSAHVAWENVDNRPTVATQTKSGLFEATDKEKARWYGPD